MDEKIRKARFLLRLIAFAPFSSVDWIQSRYFRIAVCQLVGIFPSTSMLRPILGRKFFSARKRLSPNFSTIDETPY